MNDSEPDTPTVPVVVRDNTGILLCLLLFVFISMILLSVTLVRLGNLGKKLDRVPTITGGNRNVTYFYAP
jgi:hypothetical protein